MLFRKGGFTLGGFLLRILVVLIVYMVLFQLWVLIHLWWWTSHPPKATAFMRDRLEIMQEKSSKATIQYRWVPYDRISKHLKRAVVASEDSKFLQHEGFDWEGIELAYQKNIKKGKIVAGGSTISQQLAKNLFLSGQRTPWRKIEEAMITLMIEKMMDKRRILELYLNVIEWGNGIFGAEAAAHHYYRTRADRLDRYQSAKLAAMIPNPRYYDAHRYTRYLNRRTATIASRMRLVQVP